MIHGMKFIEKYFFLGLLVVATIVVIIILFPFLSVVLMGVALAILLNPMYEWIRRHAVWKKSNWMAALFTILVFLILLGVPLFFLGSVVFKQFQNLYAGLNSMNSTPLLDTLSANLASILPPGVTVDAHKELSNILLSLSSNIRGLFTATLNTVFMCTLMILALFYFLKDGYRWKKMVIQMSPLEDDHTKRLIHTFSHTINATIKGYLIIAVAQGLLMGIGLAIFDVPHPALWGVVAGVMSLVPMIGTALVSIPAVIYLLALGQTGNSLGLATWCLMLVGTIDNFLNPLIIGKQTALPPLVVLFAVLGGLAVMGPIGILVGPLAVAMLKTLVTMYRESTQAETV